MERSSRRVGQHPGTGVTLLSSSTHQAPIEHFPFDFRLDTAIAHVRQRVAEQRINQETAFHPEHQHLTVAAALAELERTQPTAEDLVVCHGDYCLPNVLIADDAVAGYVDLGEVGIADRWRDLAIAMWSVSWNLGSQWERPFLAAYGIDPDPARIAFYRLLYDLAC